MAVTDYLPKLPKPSLSKAVATIGYQNKAVAGGSLMAWPGIKTILTAALAWAGLGDMPPPDVLRDAILALIDGFATWAIIFFVPNLPRNDPPA
jgi:hypothetical protein